MTTTTKLPPEGDTVTAKIVLLGESSVGKSSIALRFARNEFYPNQETTVGAAFLPRTVTVPTSSSSSAPDSTAGTSVKYEIWDTAGQERYRSLAPIYYRGACGALVVYDITSVNSLKKAQTWLRELRANSDPTLVIFLLGNKKDLESLRQVSFEEGETLAREEGVNGFFETSAKENENVEDVFVKLAQTLLEHGLAKSSSAGGVVGARGVRRLEPPSRSPRSGNGCFC
ncbi:putative ras-related protein rab-5 [Trypanosoma rangeli]|uniref:Putative ras-related protein rab-5 n=1 Tax=Trypanosoma rangeli TaxID=5698 RepID=A0A422P0L6_TRYRA|nr:putative ras-related protein rab-5 [Trypanosoma rangeli]RNF11257.1 putative ras-related protein rab-5 [Trypanosoma rangeli]|eukprot:RNF11257.1 putative ras-related protein rab-5 [Trypanosoma rangeli]